jgi:hypothetical protein
VAIFGDLEIILLQIGYHSVVLIAHRRKHVDQVYFRLYDRALSLVLVGSLRNGRERERQSGTTGQKLSQGDFADHHLHFSDFHGFPVSLTAQVL